MLRQVYESYYKLSPCDTLLSRVAVIKEYLILKCNEEARLGRSGIIRRVAKE